MRNDPRLWASYRVEDYEVRVLSAEERDLGVLDGVTGGSITVSTDARIKRAGKLSVVSDKPPEWWGTKLLHVFVTVNGLRWPLGLFIPTSPQEEYTGEAVEYEIELHDKLLIPDQDAVVSAYSIPAGTELIPHVVKMLKDMGQTRLAIEPFVSRPDETGHVWTTGKNSRPLTWDAGESKLTIINDILDYCGYFSLTCDPNGVYVAEHYRVPAEREVSWEFTEGRNAIHAKRWTFEQDLANIPNRIVYTTQEAQTEDGKELPSLTSLWENRDPGSPYSYQSRGRWISEVKTDVEAADQATLDAKVKRRAANAQNPMAKVVISSAILPVALNDIARFRSGAKDMHMSIRKFDMELRAGELMEVTLRKVNKGGDDK